MKLEELFRTEAFVEEVSKFIEDLVRTKFPQIEADDRADISQEIKYKIWKMIADGKKIGNLRSYLWRVCYTTALDFLSENMKYVNVGGGEELDSANCQKENDDASLESLLEREYSKRKLLEEIERLSQSRRIVLKLALTGMNVNEIAEFMGWSTSKVNHLYYRGLEDLRRRLKGKKE
jgi:RNA polymerase sigma factor (sigma-70 family)